MPSKKEIRNGRAKLSRDSLSDSYIISLLQKGNSLKVLDIRKYPELIECKRIQVKIYRLIRT